MLRRKFGKLYASADCDEFASPNKPGSRRAGKSETDGKRCHNRAGESETDGKRSDNRAG